MFMPLLNMSLPGIVPSAMILVWIDRHWASISLEGTVNNEQTNMNLRIAVGKNCWFSGQQAELHIRILKEGSGKKRITWIKISEAWCHL